MNTQNLRISKEESKEEPRYLNQLTIKNIEEIAYPRKKDRESDVKIWTPKTQQK